ncbi:hypothetical protein L7F22_034125 [Adiantum nelumboides]|nr:hypothetical protein [Adiantum nelumboides]
MDGSTRISKWLVRLQEFEYTVQMENSTRASLVGLLTNRCYEKKLIIKPTMVKVEEEVCKLGEAHSLYFDGAYKRKVDKAAVGVVIYDEEGKKVFGKGLMLENVNSNNEIENVALNLGFEWCLNVGIKRLNDFGDALLLVKQVHVTWACKNQGLVGQLRRVKELLKRFELAHLLHVLKKDNQETDALASQQLQDVRIGAIALQQLQFQGNDCMPNILYFLETSECPEGLSKGKRQWLVFVMGISHMKLLVGKYFKQAVITNGPFEKWEIDAMGPLPRIANGKLYILAVIDYMTRWVEAQSIAKVNEKTVSKFVYTHICCRFGTPLEIVFDNGPGFRRGLLTEVCEELKVSHRHYTPYYPQSNGLMEKANGIIAGIIRKMVESKPKHRDNFLDGTIWAYKTTYRDATQFTPFHLVYGQKALQPIELNIPTIKLTGRKEQNNDEAWIDRLLNLVKLEWKREAAYHCYERKALQLKDKLNEGTKDKGLKEKSLVLRYNNALDNRFDAKFERRWEGPFIVKKTFTDGYYQLMDLNGKEHPRKVNGYRLKPYLSRILPAVFETKQASKKTKKVCCHCCSGTHEVKYCAFQHVLHEVPKNQKEKLSSPTSCLESSFQYDPVDGT